MGASAGRGGIRGRGVDPYWEHLRRAPVEVIETYVEQARAEGLQGIDNRSPGSFDLLTATVFYPDQAPFAQSGV